MDEYLISSYSLIKKPKDKYIVIEIQLLKKLPVVAKGKIEINIENKNQFFILLIFSLKSFFLKLKNNSFEIKRNR